MPLTLAQLTTRLRDRLNESTARQWTDQQLKSWINEGVKDIARKTESLTDRQTIAAIVGTGEYSLSANCLRVHWVEWAATDDNQTTPLDFSDVMNMDGFGWSSRSLQANRPYAYTLWGVLPNIKLIVHPKPSVAGNFTIYYYRLPTDLSVAGADDALTPEILPGWDDIVMDYVEFRAMRRDRNGAWVEAKALYDENLSSMFDATRRLTDQAGIISAGSAGGHLPAWLVNDY